MRLDKAPRGRTLFGMMVIAGVRVSLLSLLVLHLSALAVCSRAADSPDPVAYGSKVRFGVDRTLRFPDFQVTYIGKRQVTPPQYPRGWWVYEFKVRGKGGEQTVSWSSGTGDIGPSRFKVDGVDFQMELSRSDKLGPLRDDEMVVSAVKLP
jgi:hypothetical protein